MFCRRVACAPPNFGRRAILDAVVLYYITPAKHARPIGRRVLRREQKVSEIVPPRPDSLVTMMWNSFPSADAVIIRGLRLRRLYICEWGRPKN